MPLSLLSKGNWLFIPPTQSASYYLPRAPIWGSGPDSTCPCACSVRGRVALNHGRGIPVVRGLVSCAPLVLKLIILKILALELLPPRRSPQSRRRSRVRTIGSKRSSILCFVALAALLQRLPPLSSPSFTDARAATRSRARDRHQRSRGRRTFAFPGTSVSPHPDSCQSHGGRTRLPSRGRCTRAPILKWPRS